MSKEILDITVEDIYQIASDAKVAFTKTSAPMYLKGKRLPNEDFHIACIALSVIQHLNKLNALSKEINFNKEI